MMTGNISNRNQLSPEWGVKANPNKQWWLVSGRYCRVCLHHRHQIVHRICLPNPGAKTSPVILHESQSRYQRKLNLSAKALMRWQMRPPCSLQAAQTLDVLGAVVEQSLEGVLWPWKWLTATATVYLWHLAVTFNNTQSNELLDQSKTPNSRAVVQGQKNQIRSRAATNPDCICSIDWSDYFLD